MIDLPGYRIIEKIYSGGKTIVYRGKKENLFVIIKVLEDEYPSLSELNSFKEEIQVLGNLKGNGIVKFLGLEKYRNSFAIIFEDIGATALSILLKEKGKYPLADIISIILKVVNTVNEIHSQSIIHRDIKPHNIVFNEKTGNLNIIDFGSASRLPKQNSFIPLSSSIEGTLAYISPEQTGRMNRSVDYRTDFYSLGVTFYQLLTGELPFLYSDPMELVHAHIAKSPLTPYQRCKIPKIISDIVMKLLEKNPDDRYQSAAGIYHDLEFCLNNIENIESVEFQIGNNDISSKFKIPDKLYGRTKEILKIVKSVKRASEGNVELVIISGRSGTGKSALLEEVEKSLVEQKGFFCSGKFDQFSQSNPYKVIAKSFSGPIKQILTQNEDSIYRWREILLNELEGNGKLISDLLPELESLIGVQPEVTLLSPTKEQNRLHLVFQKFIKTFCSSEHPLVICLDDLQWADAVSLNLIQSILSDFELRYILFILAFRNNEIRFDNQFSLGMRNWLKNLFEYKSILLEPISKFDINHLVTDTLGHDTETSKELVEILYEKTQGNPFFVKEVFKNLYDKGCIYFSNGVWNWDIDTIKSVIRISENVVSLMIEKIQDLSVNSIMTMKLAACVGDWFRISVFAGIQNKSLEKTLEDLQQIANEGLMAFRNSSVGFVQDEVREAVYTMLTAEEKSQFHYRIGSFYLKNAKENDLESQIYTIVEQLNLGISHVKKKKEIVSLVNLNITMGKKSFSISDYFSALNFFRTALGLMPKNLWETDYRKTLDLYSSIATCEYLTTNYKEADRLYEIIYQNCKSLFDKLPVIHAQLRQKAMEGKGEEAIQIGFQALNELGILMPNYLDSTQVEQAFFLQIGKYEELLGERLIVDLLHFPKMQDPKIKQAIALVTNLGDIVNLYRPDLLGFISILGVTLSLEYGNAKESSISYMMWGVVTNLVFRHYKTGYELGQLSLRLNEEIFPDELIFSKTFSFYGWNINHWVKPIKENFELSMKGFSISMANSDLTYAAYFIILPVKTSFFVGFNLEEVIGYANKSLAFAEKYKIQIGFAITLPNLLFSLALQGKTESLNSFQSVAFSEKKYLEQYSSVNQGMAYFYLRKLQLHFIANEYENCLEILSQIEKYSMYILQQIGFCEMHFFRALVLIELNSKFTNDEQNIHETKLQESFDYLKLWSRLCEENFLPKYLLISAEKARMEKKFLEAINFYNQSIESSLKYEYLNDLAIACELTGRFFMGLGKPKLAQGYILDAGYYYMKWGAAAKVKQLEDNYPQFKRKTKSILSNDVSMNTNPQISITTIGRNTNKDFLDLDTVMKVSKTISSEIHLGKLLEKMMGFILENAGAERGFFILKEREKWYIEAEGNFDSIQVLEAKPLEGYSKLSTKIVNYVIHTKEVILLNDAVKTGFFKNDLYVKWNNAKSILCYPITNAGNLIGIVYLENNLTTEAFTLDRLEILKVLSSQIAISIEKSLLYAELETKVEERTDELSKALNYVNSLLKEVTELKEKQDADYFLTTLLIEPLGKNKAVSKNVSVQFFLKQLNRFTFREREYEIGGDINISETISLQKRKYVVFLNGDAMGKSIQGAGGVVVIGTVFKSILQRTKTFADNSIYPEKWLERAFIEMQNVFEGFEGSMVVSTLFGLVDEITGTIYFINAGHPSMVILRDGKAEYILNQRSCKKLGEKGEIGVIAISLFQMYTGDIVIVGSDGREDLILGSNLETGKEVRNRDENLFLRIVADSQGKLQRIYEGILAKGKIIDDISLIQIEYKESSGQVIPNSRNLELLKETMEVCKDKKDWEDYYNQGQKLILAEPYNSQHLFAIFNVMAENQNFEKAIELGERIRLREPENLDNLVNLIEMYIEFGKKERAWELFDQLEIFSANEKFKEIEDKLRGQIQ